MILMIFFSYPDFILSEISGILIGNISSEDESGSKET
jgi:hypothetical protein